MIVVSWYITFMFLTTFQCPGHFNAVEDGNGEKYCTLNFPWALGLAISDFLLDLVILVLPIPRIWRLHTSTLKKLSIIGIFALAFVGLGASIARLDFYIQDRGAQFWSHHDFERMYTQIMYIQMLESGISITAVNFPCLWGLFTTRLPELIVNGLRSLRSLGSTGRSERHNSEYSDEAGTSISIGKKPSAADSMRGAETDIWSPQRPSLRSDLESETFAASATHQPESVLARPDFTHGSNSIRMERSLEVRHK